MAKAKHLTRYLLGTRNYALYLIDHRLTAQHHGTKDGIFDLEIYADCDWAGCTKSRRSTTGRATFLTGTLIEFTSRTQGSIATSSGEAELYAIGSGAAEGLAILQFLKELKITCQSHFTIYTDSSAAKSMVTRIGPGRNTKHVQLRFFYMQ